MKQIEIEERIPAILTKDHLWYSLNASQIVLEPGAVILLPEDAILIYPPDKGKDDVDNAIP